MNPYISIILPSYNVEKYLNDCLNSVINQTLTNIEIICVDDGSTDNSLKILKDYEKKDNRIHVYEKQNSGPGATRNFGLNHANGEYVLFVDSDDWIDIETCEILYNNAKSKDLDLLIFLSENFDENNNVFYEDNYYNNSFLPDSFNDTIFNHEDIKDYLFSLATVPYNKLYRRSILEKFNIRFPEDIFFEDNSFHYEVLLTSKKISILRKHFSLRRRRDNSTTHQYDEKFLDVIKASDYVFQAFKKYNQFDENIFRLTNYKIDYLKRWYKLIDNDFKGEYWKLMFDNLYEISKDFELHDKFLDNLHNVNKNFYLNVLKSHNFIELDYLNSEFELELKNKKLFEENNKVLLEKEKQLNELEQKIETKNNNLIQFQQQLDSIEKELEEKQTQLNKNITNKEKELEEKHQNFNKYVESKDTYFTEKEKELEEKQLKFEKETTDKKSLLELKEKEINGIMTNSKFKFISKFIPKKPKISIIVPVYNAELYLNQCIDSLLNQTLYDIEILCMNDGSTDNSLDILREYEKQDPRIKVFTQKNKGQGVARNRCLDKATGEYIMFLDSDDWLDEKTCKILYEKAKLDNLDMVMFLIINYSEETGEFYEDNYYNLSILEGEFDNRVFSYKDLGNLVFSVSVSPCQKIYKREILEDVRFSENIFFEDNPFYWDAMFSSERISIIREHFYLRRRHESSTTAKHNYKFLDVIEISNLVINIFKKHDLIDDYYKRLCEYKILYIKQWFNVLDKDTKYDYWKLMKKDYLKIKQDISKHEKFIENLTPLSKKFYLNTLKSRSPQELEYLSNYDNSM